MEGMRSPRPLLFVALAVAGVALSSCTGHVASEPSTAVAESPSPHGSPSATATPVPDSGPVEAFRAWWTAVRSSDTVAACGALTAGLQERMLTEYTASTGLEVEDCAELVRQSSLLYAAAGMSPDVDVAVVTEQGDDAVLDVTYASGDCGTVHLSHTTGVWMLTELSQECAER